MVTMEFVNIVVCLWIENVVKMIQFGLKEGRNKILNFISIIEKLFLLEKKIGYLPKKGKSVIEDPQRNGSKKIEKKFLHTLLWIMPLELENSFQKKTVKFVTQHIGLRHIMQIIEKDYPLYGYVKYVM